MMSPSTLNLIGKVSRCKVPCQLGDGGLGRVISHYVYVGITYIYVSQYEVTFLTLNELPPVAITNQGQRAALLFIDDFVKEKRSFTVVIVTVLVTNRHIFRLSLLLLMLVFFSYNALL
jgi:hypothetical protein